MRLRIKALVVLMYLSYTLIIQQPLSFRVCLATPIVYYGIGIIG